MAIIFHVGPPKTGTSSLQVELWRGANAGTLGAYYPTAIDLNLLAARIFRREDDSLDDLEAIYNDYKMSGHEHCIFSAEGLSDLGYIDFNYYNQSVKFFSRLQGIFSSEEVILLYTLTEDDSKRMESQVLEAIKHGKSFADQTILDYIKSVPYFAAEQLYENVARALRPSKVIILRLSSVHAVFNATQSLFGLHFQQVEHIPVINTAPDLTQSYIQYLLNERIHSVWGGCQEDKAKAIDEKCIELFSALRAPVDSVVDQFEILELKTRNDLFSAIDPRFDDQKEEIANYVTKFSRDTYFYSEACLKPLYRDRKIGRSLQGILDIFMNLDARAESHTNASNQGRPPGSAGEAVEV